MKVALRDYLKRNANVPNALTAIRMLLIPLYLILFSRGLKYPAMWVFLAAASTDMLDGMIARRFNLITDLGKLMDPLADKLMVLTVMFSMAIGNQSIAPVVPWPAVCIVLGKELLMMAGGLLMLRHHVVVYSRLIGKTAHALFVAGLTATFFHDWLVKTCAGWFLTPDLILLWLAVALTLCAMVFYIVGAVGTLKTAEKP